MERLQILCAISLETNTSWWPESPAWSRRNQMALGCRHILEQAKLITSSSLAQKHHANMQMRHCFSYSLFYCCLPAFQPTKSRHVNQFLSPLQWVLANCSFMFTIFPRYSPYYEIKKDFKDISVSLANQKGDWPPYDHHFLPMSWVMFVQTDINGLTSWGPENPRNGSIGRRAISVWHTWVGKPL